MERNDEAVRASAPAGVRVTLITGDAGVEETRTRLLTALWLVLLAAGTAALGAGPATSTSLSQRELAAVARP